jgi:hypothetical protein
MMQDATDFDLPVLLTTPEIVRLLRVDRSTMTRWRSAGTGPKVTWLVAHTPRYNQDDVLGRRKYVRGKTRGEVQREIRRLVAEAEEGRLSPDRAPTLATWLERYLNEVASTTVRPSTLHRYRQEISALYRAFPGQAQDRPAASESGGRVLSGAAEALVSWECPKASRTAQKGADGRGALADRSVEPDRGGGSAGH